MKIRTVAYLESGDTVESGLVEVSNEQFEQLQEVIQDVMGTSGGGHLTLEDDNAHINIIPRFRILYVRIERY